MKKFVLYFGLALSTLLVGCGKPLDDVNDYFPEVRILSYTPEVDGSITITAELVNEGAADVEYVGMCFSENGTPNSEDDQKLSTLSGNRFTVNYSLYTSDSGSAVDLNSNETYYVRAFATNDYGYAWSSVFVVLPWTVPAVDAPCSPTLNTISYGSGTLSVFPFGPSTVNDTYDYTMNTASADFKFAFGGPLETGVFTTASSASFLSSHQVYIQITIFETYYVLPGSLVYVNEISNNYFEVTVCSAPTSIGETYNFTTRFRANG
jgi:hypothetical protein